MHSKRAALREIANRQGGFFTARQATEVGYSLQHSDHYTATGDWTREVHGIYKLSGVPSDNPALDGLHLWLLWTIGRKGIELRGAYAYETAMAIFGISDLMITKKHISVPPSFRVSKTPSGVVLHREKREASDIIEWNGLRVVRALRTIVDLLHEGRVSREHIERGFKDAATRGLITHAEFKAAQVSAPERATLKSWWKEVR